LGTGGTGAERLQVMAVGGAGRGGGTGRKARPVVGAAASVPGCVTGVRAGSNQAHTQGSDVWVAARSDAIHGA
jgi:hypothetical protein